MKNLWLDSENNLTINGVKKVISCTQSQAVIETDTQKLVISGNEIEANKIDLQNGEVCLDGKFNNIKLQNGMEKKSLLKRIFK